MGKLSSQRGFTMIEVMISLLIISIGFMGLFALQSHAISQSYNQRQAFDAGLMVDSIITHILANPTPLERQQYQNIAAEFTQNSSAFCTKNIVSCTLNACSVDNMAQYAMQNTLCQTPLIAPSLVIDCQNTPCTVGSAVNVTLSWDAKQGMGLKTAGRRTLEATTLRTE